MPPIFISDVMREEHKRLAKMLLNVIVLNKIKSPELYERFMEFKWNIEKHFFVEEKAIFSAYSSKVNVGRREVNLIAEHRAMTAMLRGFEKSIEGNKSINLSKFKGIMFRHQKTEDDYFYTGLEENLNEDQKADIVEKSLEIIKV